MWTYSQATGKVSRADGAWIITGYSGSGAGKNNPAAQQMRNIGPIPRGRYTIGKGYTHKSKGPVCMRLTPDATNEMFGRRGFLIHGDSIHEPGTASNGCIVVGRMARLEIATSGDRELEVVA